MDLTKNYMFKIPGVVDKLWVKFMKGTGIEYNTSIAEMWSLYCALARELFPEKYAYMVTEDPRRIERRNEMIAELAPLIEKYGFEIEEDMD